MEQQIQKSINEQINLAFLYLLDDTITLWKHPFAKKLDKIHPSLKETKDFIYDHISKLPEVLEQSSEEKYALTEKILSTKNNLIRQFHLTYSYISEISIFRFMLEESFQLHQFLEMDTGDLDYQGFYHDCYHFLFDDEGLLETDTKVRQVLKHVPIRMTKEKFFDYVRESIELIDIEDGENSVGRFFAILKQQFLGTTMEGYDAFFPEAVEIIKSLFDLNLKNTSTTEMETLAEKTSHLSDTLQELNEYISLIYDAFNHLTILLVLEDLELGFIFNQHIAYTDLYKTTCSMIDSDTSEKEKEIFMETLSERLNVYIDEKQDEYDEVTEELFSQISTYEEDYITPSIQHLLDTEGLIKMYLEMNIYDQFSYGKKVDDGDLNPEVLTNYVDDFIDFVKLHLLKMSVTERKARMRNVLGFLPPYWNEDQVMNYIQTSIEFSSTEELKALAVSKIGTLMEDYGYFLEDHECDHEHHHHNHNDSHHH